MRALIVDDERHLVQLIESNLKRQGQEVSCAYSGKEAISSLSRRPFDLVVLDLDMPGLNGCDLLRWIRTNETTKGAFVWMLASEEEFAESCPDSEHRADRYHPKHGPCFSISFGASKLKAKNS